MNFWEAARELDQAGKAFVVVTMVSTRGHAPQDPGAKIIVTGEGLKWGTVGGGKVEAHAIVRAQELLSRRTAAGSGNQVELVTWNLQRDIGMSCGGEVTYLFEVHRSRTWKIVVFGAGHVAQALVRALEPLSCQVTCLDPRSEWIERLPRSSKIQGVVVEDLARSVEQFDADTFFIVMTQGHASDLPILEKLLKTFPNAPYLGGIGSAVKALKLRKELKALGVEDQAIEKLHCPIGLPMGSNDPAEIAISIVAQLLQIRDSLARA